LRVTAEVDIKTYCSDPEIKQQCSVGKTNLSMLKEIEASQDEHQEHAGDFFLNNEVTIEQVFVFFRPIKYFISQAIRRTMIFSLEIVKKK